MKRDGMEVVYAAYEAIRNGDAVAAAALVHPEITIRQSDRLPWGGFYQGLAGFREFFTTVSSHISSTVEPEAVYQAGDRVVQVGRTRGTVRANGRPFDSHEVHIWQITDGLISALEIYVEDETFLAVLGEGSA
ncbi:nuclear transport factor 2 family protein [Streptomyces sp. NBC_01450]|jgi:ketosteroid isomerase-like protein|uniref:nuclear transport factor 2 family protein n=1 Tax=Streptomyces sp. NBC_01450 TaxID=2903871 RepID=UPI002E31FF78|nr:nuclear transport factor 2 family protein [Streptomyces sp. NBC_01450]